MSQARASTKAAILTLNKTWYRQHLQRVAYLPGCFGVLGPKMSCQVISVGKLVLHCLCVQCLQTNQESNAV